MQLDQPTCLGSPTASWAIDRSRHRCQRDSPARQRLPLAPTMIPLPGLFSQRSLILTIDTIIITISTTDIIAVTKQGTPNSRRRRRRSHMGDRFLAPWIHLVPCGRWYCSRSEGRE